MAWSKRKKENYKQQVTDLNRKIKEYEKMLQGESTVFNDNEARKYRAMCLRYAQENKKLKERCVKLEKDCIEKQEKINNLSFAHKVLDKWWILYLDYLLVEYVDLL